MDYLRTFYDIMVAAGQKPPPWELWGPMVQRAIEERRAELWPLAVGTQMVGGVLFVANTVHITVLPEHHGTWLTRRLLRAYDTWTHEVPILAPIPKDNPKAAELARRLGFKHQQAQGLVDLYVKEPKRCPQ